MPRYYGSCVTWLSNLELIRRLDSESITGLVLLGTECACELWILEQPSEQPSDKQRDLSKLTFMGRLVAALIRLVDLHDIADLKHRSQIAMDLTNIGAIKET